MSVILLGFNEEKVPIVKEIFNLYLQGKTYTQIAPIMKEKYPNVISKYKKVGKKKIPIYRKWEEDSISSILNNKAYIGIYEWGKSKKDGEIKEIKGKITPIISEDIFNQCQKQIKRNSRNYYRNKHYLFFQKVKCPNCGRIMACNGTKKPNGTEYLYYQCVECKELIREDLIEKVMIEKLQAILELYLILEENCYIVDKDIANDFNNCKIDNKIRFAIDSNIIEEKINFFENGTLLKDIWDKVDYETKEKFIMEYVDYIEVKKKKTSKLTYDINIICLNLVAHKLKQMAELNEKNMIDEIIYKDGLRFSKTTFKTKKEANNYINILKKKYDFNVIDVSKNKDYYINNELLFKVIGIEPTHKVENATTLWLELGEAMEEIIV